MRHSERKPLTPPATQLAVVLAAAQAATALETAARVLALADEYEQPDPLVLLEQVKTGLQYPFAVRAQTP